MSVSWQCLRLAILATGLLFGCIACVSYPENSLRLSDALQSDQVVTLPIQFREDGIIILKGVDIGGQKFDFMMDTGATRSAIFERTQVRIPQATDNGPVNVHGISDVEQVASIIVPELKLGTAEFYNNVLVVLPDRSKSSNVEIRNRPYDGLIGMDFLERYALHLDRKSSQIHLIPNTIKTRIPVYWFKADLYENPFGVDGKSLHFFSAKISEKQVPALLDTGAQLSVINWNEKTYPLLKRFRKKLRENWEYQGAVGTFEPSMRVNIQSLSAGEVGWTDKHFIAMQLDNLNVLGMDDGNVMIAGANLLDQEEMVIDFENDVLAVKPSKSYRASVPITVNPF